MSKSARSAAMRLLPCANTTLPVAIARFSSGVRPDIVGVDLRVAAASISTLPMKCQSFWLFDASRLVARRRRASVSQRGAAGVRRAARARARSGARLRQRDARARRDECERDRNGRFASGTVSGSGVVEAYHVRIDELQHVAEQENRSGDDDARRDAPGGGERVGDDGLDRRSAARRDRPRALGERRPARRSARFDARVTTSAADRRAAAPRTCRRRPCRASRRTRAAAVRAALAREIGRERRGAGRVVRGVEQQLAAVRPAGAAPAGPASRRSREPGDDRVGRHGDAARVEHLEQPHGDGRVRRPDARPRRPSVAVVAPACEPIVPASRLRRRPTPSPRSTARPRSTATRRCRRGSAARPTTTGTPRLDDAGLLDGDLAQRRAEVLLVIEARSR